MNRSRRPSGTDVAGTLRYHSEERFRLLVESVKDYAIFVLDNDGRVASWNAGAERVTGYPASEAIGMPLAQLYGPEARETQRPQQELALAEREGRAEDEGWRVGRGGERFWAHTVITALRDNAGALRGYASIFRDLSDRRRQEQQALRTEERLRALLASVRDYAIVMLDPEGTVVGWSEGAQAILGYRAEQIMGTHFACFFPAAAVQAGVPQRHLEAAATEGRFEDENWRLRGDGSRFWANVVTTALRDRDSRLIGYSKIMRDLTERRHQEEVLRESQERFRLLIESVEEYAICMLDAEGNLMSWNAGAQTIHGFESADIVGRHFSRLYLAEEIHAGRPWQELELAAARGRLETEGLRVRKDGTAFCARVLIVPARDSEGRLRGFSHVTHDLTRQRHMRALEDSARRMNEFLAVLSHELRNPLAPIRHAAGLLQGRPDAAALETIGAIIDRQLSHLTRVVDDLLDVSRIVHGRITLVREPLEISQVVARARELAMPQIQRRGQSLHVAPFDAALGVDGDLVRLTQVLANLLDNASRYSPEGAEVRLEVHRVDDEVQLGVQDRGRGISAARLPGLFYFFAHAERSEGGDSGLGVGLGLARRLVELHGGRIGAQSEGIGRGARFTVSLPLRAAQRAGVRQAPRAAAGPQPSPAAAQRHAAAAAAAGAAVSPSARRVLVVDDNVDSALSLTMLLQTMGYEAQSAHDGAEALDASERFAPDTVLLDIGLPRVNGYEVARRLRARDGQRQLLIALTGWGQQEDRDRARAAGFDYHLVKPVDLTALAGILAPAADAASSGR